MSVNSGWTKRIIDRCLEYSIIFDINQILLDGGPGWCFEVDGRADEFGIRIGIHCHGGYMFGGSYDVMKHLLETSGDRVGLNIDTAWCMQIGPRLGKPIEWARDRFKGRVKGVHYKDFVFGRDGSWQDVVVGEGGPLVDGSLVVDAGVDVRGREILDSRGNPTVEVDVELASGAIGRARQGKT